MREYITREMNEENVLCWFVYRWGFLEMTLNTSAKNLSFETFSSVTKASGKGSCVRFPKVEIAFKIPSYEVVERPKQGEKLRITCNPDLYHYNKRELNKDEKKVTINEYVEQFKTDGSSLNKEYKDLLKSYVVNEIYKLLYFPVTDKEIANYLTLELFEKFKKDIHDEEVVNYLLENHIILVNFEI